ncbi:hypothetical protein O5290_30780, partial [Escherichia coli]|nr:hypothetical protein [Escherichia coli]
STWRDSSKASALNQRHCFVDIKRFGQIIKQLVTETLNERQARVLPLNELKDKLEAEEGPFAAKWHLNRSQFDRLLPDPDG